MTRWSGNTLVLAVAFALAAPAAAHGQSVPSEGGPRGPTSDRLEALQISSEASFRLDGLLTEEFWQEAPAASDFRQREPDDGAPATERTEVRIVYDDEVLLVGVMAYDSDPQGIVARILQRDRIMTPDLGRGLSWAGDDGVAILLDPFHDHRSAMVFATNPNGAEFEALFTDEGQEVNVSWRAVWQVAAARTPNGWSAEFEIPLRSLRYPEDLTADEPWGFNVYRMIRRKNEQVLWQSWSRDDNEGFDRVSQAGHITGLTDLPRTGLNIEAKPYALAGTDQVRQGPDEIPTEGEFDAGLDLKSEVRPGLLLDLTVNTDFAQVEVDDEQVNLTRFDLFFPEKRDFFLENAGIFDFGQRGFRGPPPILAFFSRRIGISPDGEVGILGGARLTGRVGNQTVGFLNVATDDRGSTPKENFAVARIKRDVRDRDYIGLIVTDRRRISDVPSLEPGLEAEDLHPDNTTVGVDGTWWFTRRLQFQGFFIRSFTEGVGGEDNAFKAALDYTADKFGFFMSHMSIEPELTTRAGFTLRTDVRQNTLFLRWSPRPEILGLRKIDIRPNGFWQTRTDGEFQDWNAGLWITAEWDTGDQASIQYTPGESQVDADFVLADQAPVPAGRFRTDSWQWSFNTTQSRPVSGGYSGGRSDFFGGRLWFHSWNLRLAPSPAVEAGLGFTRNDVDVPGGDFVTNIASLRLAYAFSTKVNTDLLVQYNSLAEIISTNLRFNFIHRPGSDLFVVLTESRGEQLGQNSVWDLQDRGLVVKLTWLQRF